MPEIGPTLREARMRARIDISEIEAETKIRAKYLRALENEEWDLLPGPTFVKSFLRTYADALGLDSRALLEEYKLRYERLSDVDLQPIAPLGADRRQSRSSGPGIPRAYVAWGLLLLVLAGIYAISALGGGGSSKKHPKVASTPATTPGTATTTTTTTAHHSTPAPTGHHHTPAKPRTVRLQLVPTGAVSVCLKAAGGRTLLSDVTLSPGTTQPTYHSSKFDIALGNGLIELRIDGVLRHVPAVSAGTGYEITRGGRRTLAPAQRPSCT
jgi:cytoskeleton protein RodZ